MLLDDAAFGGQVMVGAGQPVAIGVGPGSKVRGSAFIEGPMQVGKAGAFNSAEGTLMVGQTDNIDCNSPDRSLYVKGDVRIEGDGRSGIELYVEGDAIFSVGTGGKTLSARFDEADSKPVKPFDISHPSKGEGHRLRYVCLEGPEVGVYFRGRITNRTEIELPLYWKDLVHINSISVQLQPIGTYQNIIVKEVDEEKIHLQEKDETPIDCYYHIYAERKDVNALVVEYEGETYLDYPDKDYKDSQYANRVNTRTA